MAATRSFTRSVQRLSRSFTPIAAKPTPPLRHRTLLAVTSSNGRNNISPPVSTRSFSTRQALNGPNPSHRKEPLLLDGSDYEHWLVVMDPPDESWTRDRIIDHYIKTLAEVVGSEEEARMKIYSVSTKHYFAFGALVSEELSYKIREIPGVLCVLEDSYLDAKTKDYGGEPFINGQAVPYDPKYHEEWVNLNQRAQNMKQNMKQTSVNENEDEDYCTDDNIYDEEDYEHDNIRSSSSNKRGVEAAVEAAAESGDDDLTKRVLKIEGEVAYVREICEQTAKVVEHTAKVLSCAFPEAIAAVGEIPAISSSSFADEGSVQSISRETKDQSTQTAN